MAIPNLIGLLLLHKEIKTSIKDYWIDFKQSFPGVKTPV
jgi:AGCS family alanine or glycine:cation symporter